MVFCARFKQSSNNVFTKGKKGKLLDKTRQKNSVYRIVAALHLQHEDKIISHTHPQISDWI